jgi:hypothetical protein
MPCVKCYRIQTFIWPGCTGPEGHPYRTVSLSRRTRQWNIQDDPAGGSEDGKSGVSPGVCLLMSGGPDLAVHSVITGRSTIRGASVIISMSGFVGHYDTYETMTRHLPS